MRFFGGLPKLTGSSSSSVSSSSTSSCDTDETVLPVVAPVLVATASSSLSDSNSSTSSSDDEGTIILLLRFVRLKLGTSDSFYSSDEDDTIVFDVDFSGDATGFDLRVFVTLTSWTLP
ncbi:hypothetical protein ACM66B_000532 [Microbotryomycetes sp. NB124-2]